MNQYEMKQRAYQSNLKSRALQVLLYLIDRSNEEGQHYYPRICIIVVGILFVSIIFFAISKFSLLFLIACTNVLVVISKFLEKRQEE